MIYSPKCNNPSKGFKNVDGCQVAIAGRGYPVLTLEECEEAMKSQNHEWLNNKIMEMKKK